MDFEFKKEHILRCVSLGMELNKAYIVAECDFREIDELNRDREFLAKVELHYALEERRLLEELRDGSKKASENGNTQATRWKLERLNPDRYQTKRQNSKEDKVIIPKVVNIKVTGKGTE